MSSVRTATKSTGFHKSCYSVQAIAKLGQRTLRSARQTKQNLAADFANSGSLECSCSLPRSIKIRATTRGREGFGPGKTAVAWRSRLRALASHSDVRQSHSRSRRSISPDRAKVTLLWIQTILKDLQGMALLFLMI